MATPLSAAAWWWTGRSFTWWRSRHRLTPSRSGTVPGSEAEPDADAEGPRAAVLADVAGVEGVLHPGLGHESAGLQAGADIHQRVGGLAFQVRLVVVIGTREDHVRSPVALRASADCPRELRAERHGLARRVRQGVSRHVNAARHAALCEPCSREAR